MGLRATSCELALLLLTSSAVLSACGSAHTVTTAPSQGQPRAPHPPRSAPPAKPLTSTGPRIGSSQSVRVEGTRMVVTITSVLDPLRRSGAAVSPGMKVVGVLASVRDTGPAGYDGSATSDFALRSAAGLATPVFVPSGPCQTQVQDFMNAIGADERRTGCVAFSLPKRALPTSVRFTPDGNSRHSRSWFVPEH